MSEYNEPGTTTDSLVALYGRKWYTGWVNDVQTFQKTEIGILSDIQTAKSGQTIAMGLQLIKGRIPYVGQFNNNPTSLEACFFQNGDIKLASKIDSGLFSDDDDIIPFKFKVPHKPGKYELLFSIRTLPFPGSKNSQTIEFTVR